MSTRRATVQAIPWSALALLVGTLLPCVASAYRPFDGTDGGVAAPGELELELGPLHFAQQGKTKLLLTPSVLNLGVAKHLELVADFVAVYPRHGPIQLTDTDVLVKYVFRSGVLQGESGPSIAVEGGPLLPEVNGQRGFGLSLNVIASVQFRQLTLHLNNEGELSRDALVFGYTAHLMAELELGSALRPVAELSFEIEPSSGAQGYGALAGVIWTLGDEVALDAAGRMGRLEGERTLELRLGLTWAISGADDGGPTAAKARDHF
jgi:hypothetical protein